MILKIERNFASSVPKTSLNDNHIDNQSVNIRSLKRHGSKCHVNVERCVCLVHLAKAQNAIEYCAY